jgi:tryptophan-rich sensory protein
MNIKRVVKKIKTVNIARVIIIAYIIFISIFAFDTTFGAGFFIHLLPTIIFTVTLVITWKKSKLAGILFILEGLGTILVFNTYRDFFVLFVVSLIPVLTGLVFFLSKNPKH